MYLLCTHKSALSFLNSMAVHPDPLPRGEGTARIAQWKASGSGLFSARRMVRPLPKGESWGEGKETTGPPSADVLALARGQCLQGYVALSHSLFHAPGFAGGR